MVFFSTTVNFLVLIKTYKLQQKIFNYLVLSDNSQQQTYIVNEKCTKLISNNKSQAFYFNLNENY